MNAADSQKGRALAIVEALPDVRRLLVLHPSATFDTDSDISLAAAESPSFCPGEYVVTMNLAGPDGNDNRVWFVDLRSGATRRGRKTDREVEELIQKSENAEDVEHRFPRAEMCLNGKPSFVIPHDAVP